MTLTYPLEIGVTSVTKTGDNAFAYTTQLQLFGRVGMVYNRGYYGRYPVTVVGEVAWTTSMSRGTA
jgi:hypothetical protein